MKIDKNERLLFEEKLFEDVDGEISTSDSVADIADEVAEVAPVSDASAEKIASEVKAAAADTGIDTAVVDSPIDDDEPLGVKNAITEVLDEALAKSQKNKKRGAKSGFNVLVIGLPGSGKTASILDWAKFNGVNLVMVNAKNNDLDAYINGYTTKDPERPRKVVQAFSDNLAELEKPNSVLFLDEYNRQVKPHIRASLYTLINEHKIVGEGPDGMHEFKNMLFTIAAINPSVPTDKGAADLNDAEKSRFWWTLDDMDSDPVTTIEYLTKYYGKLIRNLNPKDEDYKVNLEDYLRIQDLGLFIVSHPKFAADGYDTRDDLEDLALPGPGGRKYNLLCQRSLTQGLHNSEGNVKDFKRWIEKGANFLPRDTEMLLAIIREYITPSFEDLCAGHGIAATVAAKTPEVETVADEGPGVEDDDDFFVSSDKAGTVRAKNPYEVEVAIASAIKDW